MKIEKAYPIFLEANKANINLLFQRLNYFFVATAFLIAGFATSYATARAEDLNNVLWIAYALIGIGFILSLFFTIINYLNARIIYKCAEYIMKLEKLDFNEVIKDNELPSKKMKTITSSVVREGIWKLISALFQEMYYLTLVFVCNKRRVTYIRNAEKSIASHVYLLPFVFAVFWITLLGLALGGS